MPQSLSTPAPSSPAPAVSPIGPLEESRNAAVMESLLKSATVFAVVFGIFALFNFLGYWTVQNASTRRHLPLFFIDGCMALYAAGWSALARKGRIPSRHANLSAAVFAWLAMGTILFASVQIPEFYLQQQTFFLLAVVWAGASILSRRWLAAAVFPPAAALVGVYIVLIDALSLMQAVVAVACFLSCAWILHSIRYAYWFRSEHLRRLALSLVGARDELETARQVVQHASAVLGVRSWVVQVETKPGELEYLSSRGKPANADRWREWVEGAFLAAKENPADLTPRLLEPARGGRGQVLGVPLANAKVLRAIAWFERRGRRKYNLHEKHFAGTCAIYARQALEAIGLNKQVEKLATVDELTQLFNRRQFFFLAERELHRRGRSFRSLAVIMADIDHFKKINDTWGHPAGDAVLSEVARRLKGALREMDILGRYGGEEFSIMLLDTDRRDALEIAERLRRSVQNTPVRADGRDIAVTISLGVALRSQDEETTLDTLIARADKSLYQAKEAGRNRVVTAATEPPPSPR